jgi:hypothetical protein
MESARMITKLVEYFRYGSSQVIANWTPEKAKYYERETLKYLGRGEVAYTWSRQFTRKDDPWLTSPSHR